VGHVLHEFFHTITHTDKGVFPLAKNLVTRPGTLAKDLVEGRRKKHFNLFQYLVIILAITTFLMVKFNFMERSMDAVNSGLGNSMTDRVAQFQKQLANAIQKYYNLLMFLMLPVSALVSWLLLRKRKYNYAEHLVFHAVVAAANTTVVLFILPVFGIYSSLAFSTFMFLGLMLLIIFYTMAYRQFFGFSWGKSIGITIAVYAITYILQVMLTSVISVILYLTFFNH
jgi:hypothetical protein